MNIVRVWLLVLVTIGFISNISTFSTESEYWKFNWILVSASCYFVCFLILMLVKII